MPHMQISENFTAYRIPHDNGRPYGLGCRDSVKKDKQVHICDFVFVYQAPSTTEHDAVISVKFLAPMELTISNFSVTEFVDTADRPFLYELNLRQRYAADVRTYASEASAPGRGYAITRSRAEQTTQERVRDAVSVQGALERALAELELAARANMDAGMEMTRVRTRGCGVGPSALHTLEEYITRVTSDATALEGAIGTIGAEVVALERRAEEWGADVDACSGGIAAADVVVLDEARSMLDVGDADGAACEVCDSGVTGDACITRASPLCEATLTLLGGMYVGVRSAHASQDAALSTLTKEVQDVASSVCALETRVAFPVGRSILAGAVTAGVTLAVMSCMAVCVVLHSHRSWPWNRATSLRSTVGVNVSLDEVVPVRTLETTAYFAGRSMCENL